MGPTCTHKYKHKYTPFQRFQCKGICYSRPHNVHDQLQLLVPSLSTLKRANTPWKAPLHCEEIPIAYLVWGNADNRDPPELATWVSFMYALISPEIYIIACAIRICMG
jgi:hypothetical protein